MLLALKALEQAASAPVANLRTVNPYVTAALADWRAHSGMSAVIPRLLAPNYCMEVGINISNLTLPSFSLSFKNRLLQGLHYSSQAAHPQHHAAISRHAAQ